jgi:ATP-dependent 26S proteasome regulatory subunit
MFSLMVDNMYTHTPYRYLPREVDPLVYNMSHEDPGSISYSEIGGLAEQIRELREVHVTSYSTVSTASLKQAGVLYDTPLCSLSGD